MTSSHPRHRRQFLAQSTRLLAAPLLLGSASSLVLAADQDQAADAKGVLLSSGTQNLFRVRMEMEVKGNVNVPKNPLVSRTSDVRFPIQSDAVFDYEERYHRTEFVAEGGSGSDPKWVTALERYYHKARSDSKINRSTQRLELRDSVRETVVRREFLPEIIYATDDYFRRDELELLRLPASSAAVDELLPDHPVTSGSKYTPSTEAIRSVLNLTSVEASDVTAEIVSISDKNAKIQLNGKVDGSVDGVPTVIRTVGKVTFDRIAETCTWFAMAIHETREIGKAEPGFDVAATIRMVRQPLRETMALPQEPRPIDLDAAPPKQRLYVDLGSRELGLRVLMDRRWRMMSDIPGTAMMRMIDNDRSIAQCDFRSLVALEAGDRWTLDEFQEDVRRTLGEQLSELIEADRRQSDSGLEILRITASGAVQSVPIRWIMLHFSDPSGRRMLATFTMEGENIKAFGPSDAQLASTLRFTEPASGPGTETTPGGPDGSGNGVAKANLGEDPDGQVQSSSDLR